MAWVFSTRLWMLRTCLVALLWSFAWHAASAQGSAAGPAAASPPVDAEWRAFRNRYVTAPGRVIDTANNGISHSEGQGYGMFFAVQFNDRASFDRLWGWTQHNLARRQDGLFAWRYDSRSNFPVSDTNNATDGDIYIAWALAMAAERWGIPDYRAAATRMVEDILKCCVTEVGGRTILLPGTGGFRSAEGTVVNLSYYAFPALRALSRLVSDRRWARLERDGLEMIRDASLGRWRLPPDWLLLPQSGGPSVPAPAWPARFSWDALRVPLNLAWLQADHETIAAARRFWSDPGHRQRPPAWVDLRTGEMPPYAGHAGVRAVQALVGSRQGERPQVLIRVEEAPDYFGAALVLQARIASTAAPEPPAAEPPEEARPPASGGGVAAVGSAIVAWWNSTETVRDDPAPEPQAQWARPEFQGVQQVRGVRPGLRGLAVPR
jgi:endo-1,4-beta-D-glucanase Y